MTGASLVLCIGTGELKADEKPAIATGTIELSSRTDLGYAVPDTTVGNIARLLDEPLAGDPPMMPDPQTTGPIVAAVPARQAPPVPKRAPQTVASAATINILPTPRPDFESTKGLSLPIEPTAALPAMADQQIVTISGEPAGTELKLPLPIIIGGYR